MCAHSTGNDPGLSAFYDLMADVWAPSYPETTGYVIPTLLKYAKRYSDNAIRRSALEMADYVLGVQTPEGGIHTWYDDSKVFVFDTGQALFGWLAAWHETGSDRYQAAMLRSANWLVAHQDPDGYWAQYQFAGHMKVWDAHVAWPLILVGTALHQPAYVEAGCRCLEWVLAQQAADGWFELCSLEPGHPPVTHTIAYAVRSLLETGILLSDDRYVQAARCAGDALLAMQRSDGSLHAYWAPGWQPMGHSSCLTGNAQIALCWLRLYELTAEACYSTAAQQALNFVASTQRLDDQWSPVQGAVAGSWPVWGHYLRWRFPNWAVKFFLDALMLAEELSI
jgi:hypothetical protein